MAPHFPGPIKARSANGRTQSPRESPICEKGARSRLALVAMFQCVRPLPHMKEATKEASRGPPPLSPVWRQGRVEWKRRKKPPLPRQSAPTPAPLLDMPRMI